MNVLCLLIPKASLIRVSAFHNYNICACQLYPVPLSEMQGTANGGQHQATDRATDPARVPVTITITHGMVSMVGHRAADLPCIVTFNQQDQDAE